MMSHRPNPITSWHPFMHTNCVHQPTNAPHSHKFDTSCSPYKRISTKYGNGQSVRSGQLTDQVKDVFSFYSILIEKTLDSRSPLHNVHVVLAVQNYM